MTLDTAAVVERARRGEAAAFALLARAFLRPAYAVALSVVGRPADAEDVAQDALAAALERIDRCREPARFAGWLFQIVRNHARNWVEKRRLRDVPREADVPERADEARPPDAGLRERLLAGLARLGAPQREILLLHDLEGWTHVEIAVALGLSEVNCRQHLFVARRTLRGLLAGDAPEKAVEHGA